MKALYWDEGNGCVTDDESCALIMDGGNIYVEMYELDDGRRLDIAYTPLMKTSMNMYDYRENICKSNGIRYSQLYRLVGLMVPHDKFVEIYKAYGGGKK